MGARYVCIAMFLRVQSVSASVAGLACRKSSFFFFVPRDSVGVKQRQPSPPLLRVKAITKLCQWAGFGGSGLKPLIHLSKDELLSPPTLTLNEVKLPSSPSTGRPELTCTRLTREAETHY